MFPLLKTLPKGRVLEIGSASGAMLLDLRMLGFTAMGLETSDKAHDVSSRILRGCDDITVHRAIEEGSRGSFDYVLALEVLEHIDDDSGALIQWRDLLKEGGRLIMSVPARHNKWSSSDVWAGHFRRYERTDLIALMRETGFELELIRSYGFPVKNIFDKVRGVYHRRILNKKSGSWVPINRKNATDESGISRKLEVKLFRFYHNRFTALLLRSACWLQSVFYSTDLGNGYILLAGKYALPDRGSAGL